MENLQNNIKEKYRDLAENPGRIFGLVYPFVLTVGVIIGMIYLGNINQMGNNKISPRLADSTVVETDLKVVEPQTVPAINISEVSKPTAERVAAGKNLYNNMCQSCHGAEGAGDGAGAAGLNPAPRNFKSGEGWKNSASLSGIYKTLQEGIPGTAMVAYDYLLPEEKIAIAQYIRETFVPNAPQDSPDDLTTLDQTYQLSQGKEIPAQIPVSAAINLKVKELSSTVQKVNQALNSINSDSGSEGARLFNAVTQNKGKALSALAANDKWRGGVDNFVNYVVSTVNMNGFDSDVYSLNNNEWNTLYGYLSSVF